MPGVNPPADQWFAQRLAKIEADIRALKAQRTQYVVDPTTSDPQAIMGDLSKDPAGNSTGLDGWGIAEWNGTAWGSANSAVPFGQVSFDTASVALTNTSGNPDYTSHLGQTSGGMEVSSQGLVVPWDGIYVVTHSVRCDTSAATSVEASVDGVTDFFVRISPGVEIVRVMVAGSCELSAGHVLKPTYTVAGSGSGTFFRNTTWGNWLTAAFIGPS